MTTLTFQNTTLSAINHNDQIWLTAQDVGKGLGYRNPTSDVKRIYERNIDEFTPNMTALVDLQTAGGMQKVRVFSLRGTHLIAMFSHTKLAKEFRKWVLDILDKVSQNNQRNLPLEPQERMMTMRLAESDLRNIAWLWFEAHKMREFIGDILPALDAIGSRYAATAYSQNQEYGNHIKFIGPLIYKMTKDADFSDRPTPILALAEAVKQPQRLGIRYR
ncbi:hypothetical protein A1D29_07770 [Pasteurellaceae bacterium Orientalotternb1]|nr:hypothetical protein A1D29_07770 [Pasteurellaceae bacterium Orientalotternb1]